MLERDSIYLVNDLSGSTNQRVVPSLLRDNESLMSLNISQEYLGAVSNRRGTTRKFDLISGTDGIQGLSTYIKSDNTNYLHTVAKGNLYVGNEDTDIWNTQESSVVATSSTVEFANFINKHYFIGSGSTEYLRSAIETGTSSLVTGNIAGKFLATNGTRLAVAGSSGRKVYWSLVGSEDFITSENFIETDAAHTGLASFGNGRPFIVFTEDSYYIFDPDTLYTNEVKGFGCSSHRSIVNIKGYLVWASRNKRCWYILAPDWSFPQEITLPIKNNVTQDAVINKIDGNSWQYFAAGTLENKYYCALNDFYPTETDTTYSTTQAVTAYGDSITWSNPENVEAVDTSDAIASNASGSDKITDYLVTTGYGFNLPSGSAIQGIEVVVRLSGSAIGASNVRAFLTATGNTTPVGTEKTDSWVASETNVTLGGSTDLWSGGWNTALINTASFGVVVYADIVNGAALNIDAISIKIYYKSPTVTGNVQGQALQDTVMVYDISTKSITLNKYDRASNGVAFTEYIDSNGDLGLYTGANGNNGVYRIEDTTVITDVNSSGGADTVTSVYRTKHFEQQNMSTANKLMNIASLHFKYYAANTVTVKYSLDGEPTYTELSTLSAYTDTDWTWAMMNLGKECKSISLEFTFTGEFRLFNYGFEMESSGTTGLQSQ